MTWTGRSLVTVAIGVLLLPIVGLVLGTGPGELLAAAGEPSTWQALGVSLGTSAVAMVAVVAMGLPAAWHLSRSPSETQSVWLTAAELPIVLPPAVLGVALLETFGRSGWLGPGLGAVGIHIPFTAAAVVLAQVLVAGPLFLLTATTAFTAVRDDHLLVARTLGASPVRAWVSVALPIAAPGLASAMGLAWARALAEFGATLLFAGNLPGTTQTLPLAIYGALERDVGQARALSVGMLGIAVIVLVGVRLTVRRRHDRV